MTSPVDTLLDTPDLASARHDPRVAAILSDPARVAALRGTGLMDTESEETFDRLCRLASRLVGAPLSFISLIDGDRDFFKSICGVGNPLGDVREVTGPTFCHSALLSDSPLVIPDVGADPRYQDLPAHEILGFSAYVGVPIKVGGHPIGAFCVIDTVPHAWTPEDVEVLVVLAESAERDIELRRSLKAERLAREALEAQNVELKHRTIEAESANLAKSQFLSAMSHELRTPLNAIGGYAELLLMEVRGAISAPQRDDLTRIQRAGRHLQTIVAEILNYARLESGSVTYEMRSLRLDDVVASSVELVEPQAQKRGITVHRDGCPTGADEGPLRIVSDPERVRQILVNLLSNAVKFTGSGGTVQVCSTIQGDRVAVSVTDTGRGIAGADIERIFAPFVQVDRSDQQSVQGVGLGLAISRDLARGLGGDLRAVSAPGVGSTFTLELPLARADA